ncbi:MULTISPECIES: protein phosphatase 2C domain-containing protein [unclassified Streptomyces]|uniref:protein phosphatase 2C domain-containing protein n=1 Tax=unclassified Streptomyces TaxID=2593676 RepID=UPI002E2D2D63|nr:protein phosphatase 2C domain-containing protein [Streptomyces sp. NBC_01429]
MSQQGETPAADEWWNRLYDESAPDAGPAAARAEETIDDRFDSAAHAVTGPVTDALPGAAPEPPAPARPEPRRAPPGPRTAPTHLGDRPPTYDPEPTALPVAHADRLDEIVPDTVLDGASYGTYTLRAVSVRGDSARYRGEPRRDALLTARFGTGPGALVLVAVACGARGVEGAHRAAADACHWIGTAVGRSHGRLSDDIRAGRRGDLKSGLHRLTDRSFGKLRARAAELGVRPEEYSAGLRCLLLSADPECRTRVFFGIGDGGLFRLRDGAWQDLEPLLPDPAAVTGAPVVGFGSPPPESRVGAGAGRSARPADGEPATMDPDIAGPRSPYTEGPLPPPPEPFRFRASVARPGDTLLLCGPGLAEPMRDEPALTKELADRWAAAEPPGLAQYFEDASLRVKGYADDRTAVGVWEA